MITATNALLHTLFDVLRKLGFSYRMDVCLQSGKTIDFFVDHYNKKMIGLDYNFVFKQQTSIRIFII